MDRHEYIEYRRKPATDENRRVKVKRSVGTSTPFSVGRTQESAARRRTNKFLAEHPAGMPVLFGRAGAGRLGVAKRSPSATTYRALPSPSPHRQLRPPARGSQGVSVRLVVWAVFADRRRFVGSRASAEL